MNTTGMIMLNRAMTTKDEGGVRHSLRLWIESDNIVSVEENTCTEVNEEYPCIVSLKVPFWQQESNNLSYAIMTKESVYDIQTRMMLHTDDIDEEV